MAPKPSVTYPEGGEEILCEWRGRLPVAAASSAALGRPDVSATAEVCEPWHEAVGDDEADDQQAQAGRAHHCK